MNQQQRKYFCNCVTAIENRKIAKLKENEARDVAAVEPASTRLLQYLKDNPEKCKEELYKGVIALVKDGIEHGRSRMELDILPYSYRERLDVDDFKIGNDCIKKYNNAVTNVRDKYAVQYKEIHRQAEDLRHKSMFCDLPDELIELLHKFDDGGVTEDDMEEGGLK